VREDRGADGHVAAGTPGAPGVAGGVAAGSGRTRAQLGAGAGACRSARSPPQPDSGPSRVHPITAAGLDERDAALGWVRAAGWPTPEDRDGEDDAELDGRDTIADRLAGEASWLRRRSGGLIRLHADGYPPAYSLRPGGDHPERALAVTGLPGVAAIVDRVVGIDELARARQARDLDTAAVLPGPRAVRRRRRLPASSAPQLERGLGRLAGRALPARRDQPTARPCR
jgi:hypothetical protein